MKTISFVALFILLLACNHAYDEKKVTTKAQQDSTVETVVHSDSLLVQKLDKEKVDQESSDANILGLWAQMGSENASFEIRKSTLFYPEHSSSFKYSTSGDSIKIQYEDYNESFGFKLNRRGDTLTLTGLDGVNTYYRIK